jgi:ADP-heptose:LPS heptosyltransferase
MNILAVRVGRVGDTVMMTPALTALIQYYPDAKITLLTSPVGKHLLKDFHPNVVDIWSWNRSGVLKPYIDKANIRKNLRQHHFDKIFCFDTSPRIAGLFDDYKGEFYWHQGSTELKHCAKSYLDFVAESCDEPVLDIYNTLPVSPDDEKLAEQALDNIGISANDTLIMFHPTFSGFSKSSFRKKEARLRKLWPTQNYGELGKKLSQTSLPNGSKAKILMVLLPDEISYGQEIVEHSNNTIQLIQSQSTFEQYKAILKRADLLITPDSGPMHVASALGTRIIAFFSMKDPGDCGPYMPPDKFTILRTEDTEAPEKGVASIAVNSVMDACKGQLDKHFEN